MVLTHHRVEQIKSLDRFLAQPEGACVNAKDKCLVDRSAVPAAVMSADAWRECALEHAQARRMPYLVRETKPSVSNDLFSFPWAHKRPCPGHIALEADVRIFPSCLRQQDPEVAMLE